MRKKAERDGVEGEAAGESICGEIPGKYHGDRNAGTETRSRDIGGRPRAARDEAALNIEKGREERVTASQFEEGKEDGNVILPVLFTLPSHFIPCSHLGKRKPGRWGSGLLCFQIFLYVSRATGFYLLGTRWRCATRGK